MSLGRNVYLQRNEDYSLLGRFYFFIILNKTKSLKLKSTKQPKGDKGGEEMQFMKIRHLILSFCP